MKNHQQISDFAERLMEALPVSEVLRHDNAGHLWQPADHKGYAQEGHQPSEPYLLLRPGDQRVYEGATPLGVIQCLGH